MYEPRLSELVARVESVKHRALTAILHHHQRAGFRASRGVRDGTWRVTTRFHCPVCYSASIRRSHRRNELEHLFSFIFVPFRCRECDTRFFISRLVRI